MCWLLLAEGINFVVDSFASLELFLFMSPGMSRAGILFSARTCSRLCLWLSAVQDRLSFALRTMLSASTSLLLTISKPTLMALPDAWKPDGKCAAIVTKPCPKQQQTFTTSDFGGMSTGKCREGCGGGLYKLKGMACKKLLLPENQPPPAPGPANSSRRISTLYWTLHQLLPEEKGSIILVGNLGGRANAKGSLRSLLPLLLLRTAHKRRLSV
mmetsp:Transcript_2683/g.7360  ORF Transcript_2683/g.7360 Transcript_2683/m.7360 type:complete len:213 (-) Transcript_2683:334-972(-)